jgi:hypothetical protein
MPPVAETRTKDTLLAGAPAVNYFPWMPRRFDARLTQWRLSAARQFPMAARPRQERWQTDCPAPPEFSLP